MHNNAFAAGAPRWISVKSGEEKREGKKEEGRGMRGKGPQKCPSETNSWLRLCYILAIVFYKGGIG